MSGTVSPLSSPRLDQLGGGHDKSKRTIGNMILEDDTNVNQTLIKDGWCWWYRRCPPDNTELEALEKAAERQRKWFWAESTVGAAVGVEEEVGGSNGTVRWKRKRN